MIHLVILSSEEVGLQGLKCFPVSEAKSAQDRALGDARISHIKNVLHIGLIYASFA